MSCPDRNAMNESRWMYQQSPFTFWKCKAKRHIVRNVFSSSFSTVIANSIHSEVIIETSQYKVTSTHLSLNLAICNLCFTIFGQIPSTFIIVNKISCNFQVFINLLRTVLFNYQNFLLLFFHMTDICMPDIQIAASKCLLQTGSEIGVAILDTNI